MESFNVDAVSLACDVASKCYLQRTPSIARCFLIANKEAGDGHMNFVADGTNFFKVLENDQVSPA